MKRRYLIIVLLTTYNLVIAQDKEPNEVATPVRFLINGALELGGDEVAEIFFTNGDSQSVKAGQGGTLSAGLRFQLPQVIWLSFDATVGFKYVTTAAQNVNIRMTRVPIHLMANYEIKKDIKLSIGVASHQSIKFSADGLGTDIPFSASNGPRFEFSYMGNWTYLYNHEL